MNRSNGHIRRQPLDEGRLDSVIDAVAKEMTKGEPSGALRARVLERIEQGRRRPSTGVPRWVWAGAAAAIVLAVATAVWVVGPTRTQDATRATVAEQRSSAPSLTAPGVQRPLAQSAESREAGSPAGKIAAVTRTSRVAAARGAQTSDADSVQDRHPVPALAEIEPLRFTAVDPDPLQIAAVEVAPFPPMPAIDIPSLDAGSDDIQSADSKKEK